MDRLKNKKVICPNCKGNGYVKLPPQLPNKEQVAQCGYCQSGQIMQAAALLADNSRPTDEEIVIAMKFNLCRCMTYPRIKKAIQRASREIRSRDE